MTAPRVNWRACFWMAVLALFVVVIGTLPTAAYGKTHHMTRAEVRVELKAAARFYHLSAAKTRWIVAKGIHIVFVGHTGYGESNGNTNTGHRNGCYGLFQFGAGWKHNITLAGVHYRDFRSSGRGSIYRFVKVYKVGGRAKILQHWRATY